MMRALCCLVLVACVPSRGAVFGPVARDVEARIGIAPEWHANDARVTPAIEALLAKPLDRDAAVRIALVANRRLQARYEELGIAAADIASATVLAPTEVDLELVGGDHVELDVVQDVLDLFQIPQRRGVAQAGLAAARARAVAATVELVARVERAYVDTLAAHQELELRQTAFEAADASAEIAERMHTAGNLSELGIARERDQREQTRIDLGRAQLAVELAREAMNAALGLSGPQTAWTVDQRLPDLPAEAPALDTLERDTVAASLDLAAVRSDAEAAAGRIGIARVRAWLPELAVGVAVKREHDEWHAGPALSLRLPIFDQQQGPRARGHAELRRARDELTALAVELRAAARATRQRTLAAHAEAQRLRDVVLPLRQRIVNEAVKHYNAMNASAFELLSARRELADAGRQYIDALRRFWRAAADARALARGAMPRDTQDTGDDRSSTSRARHAEGH
jgi:cobalt-zinc-cadmium efflux system outer membrane protein